MSNPDPFPPEDLLAGLQARLDRATDAAESLLAQAGAAAAGAIRTSGSAVRGQDGERPPPAGWQAKPEGDGAGSGDLDLLVQVLGSLRELVPADLQQRLAEALRELLLALRALIDSYLERSEHRRREVPEVEDIPIL